MDRTLSWEETPSVRFSLIEGTCFDQNPLATLRSGAVRWRRAMRLSKALA
jgi:hypothetical protein